MERVIFGTEGNNVVRETQQWCPRTIGAVCGHNYFSAKDYCAYMTEEYRISCFDLVAFYIGTLYG